MRFICTYCVLLKSASMYNLFVWLQALLKGLKMAHNPSLPGIHLQTDPSPASCRFIVLEPHSATQWHSAGFTQILIIWSCMCLEYMQEMYILFLSMTGKVFKWRFQTLLEQNFLQRIWHIFCGRPSLPHTHFFFVNLGIGFLCSLWESGGFQFCSEVQSLGFLKSLVKNSDYTIPARYQTDKYDAIFWIKNDSGAPICNSICDTLHFMFVLFFCWL